jgi:hypothetical protein
MDKQSQTIDTIQTKVGSFENDLKKLWSYIHDNDKKTSERLNRVEDRVESADFNLTKMSEQVLKLERCEEELRSEMVYLQSQSMRNNLVFSNIPEAQGVEGTNVNAEDCEQVVRDFMVSKMKMAQDLVNNFKFDRVHRMGPKRSGSNRNIVAKFTLFKERELVRRQSSALKGTGHYVYEQFPREVNEIRRQLVPRMKEEIKKGNRAWLAYDTLYVNGRPVKDAVKK